MDRQVDVSEVKKEEKGVERHISDIENRLWIMQMISVVLVIFIIAAIIYSFLSINGINSRLSVMQSEIKSISITAIGTSLNSTAVSNSTFGHRLTNIDVPFNTTELAAINNAPNSYFEQAGEMVFNTSAGNPFGETYSNGNYIGTVFLTKPITVTPYIVNGKPSVIYLGAISCVFCGENRWSMALALSRFGSFKKLFTGYSSFGDEDVPTIYWNKDNYTTAAGASFGNMYSSSYINFISADYDSPIVQGFQFPPSGPSYFVGLAPNSTYRNAYSLINKTGLFGGTPFTIWGSVVQSGADVIAFGTVPPGQSSSLLGISYLTHGQLLSQIANFNTTVAKEEYAGADVYIADICPAINNSAPVCSLPAIQKMEEVMGLNATK